MKLELIVYVLSILVGLIIFSISSDPIISLGSAIAMYVFIKEIFEDYMIRESIYGQKRKK